MLLLWLKVVLFKIWLVSLMEMHILRPEAGPKESESLATRSWFSRWFGYALKFEKHWLRGQSFLPNWRLYRRWRKEGTLEGCAWINSGVWRDRYLWYKWQFKSGIPGSIRRRPFTLERLLVYKSWASRKWATSGKALLSLYIWKIWTDSWGQK